MLVSCDKAFQDPCYSETRERKCVQQHIRICTHGLGLDGGKGIRGNITLIPNSYPNPRSDPPSGWLGQELEHNPYPAQSGP